MDLKEEIKSTIEQFSCDGYAELGLMKQLIPKSETTVHVGTDDGEILKGWIVLNEATEKQFENLEYYKTSIRNLTINDADSKDLAWYFHLLDAEIKSNGMLQPGRVPDLPGFWRKKRALGKGANSCFNTGISIVL